jgi:L-threonylcarbamoyladenylate synthase
METQVLRGNQPGAIDQALEILSHGGLVAFPTDTVYGMGGLAFDPQTIQEIYLAKGRPAEKAIPILLGDRAQLPLVTTGMNPISQCLAERFWPGPLTLVVARHPNLPDNISLLPTIGVRMPDHPLAIELLKRAGPLAVSSANLSGAADSSSAEEVLAQLGGRIPLILDGGRTAGGQPSTVVDCSGPEPVILRLGPVTLEQIQAALLA